MDDSEMIIDKVQLADIEDAVHLPSNRRMVGKQVGNYMWRSPEAHAQGPIGKSADMFSFGVVVSRTIHYSLFRASIRN